MPMFVDTSLAWALTRGMARVAGVDLVAAVAEGWLSRAELAAMVDRCAACGASAHCSVWLAVTPRSDILPDYCAIREDIMALRDETPPPPDQPP